MTFKFFKLLLSVGLSLSMYGLAEPPAATPAPAAVEKKKPKEGYMRFWNFLPKGREELRLVRDTGNPDGEVLLAAAPLNSYASYQPMTPGRYSLKVTTVADPKTVINKFDVLLRDDVYVTFVAKSVGKKIQVEMLDDTYDPEKAPVGRLVVHQQYPEVNVVVTSNTQQQSEPLSYGAAQTMDGFPLKTVAFTLQTTLSNGKRRITSAEVDFRTARRASLIVMPDPYNRFRVRLTTDGQIPPNE